jgi:hypothetical protein
MVPPSAHNRNVIHRALGIVLRFQMLEIEILATVNDKNATFSPIELHHDKPAGVSDIKRADSINKRRL